MLNKISTVRTFPLRWSLLSIFISLFACAIIAIILVTSIRFEKALSKASFTAMENVSNLIRNDLIMATEPVETIGQIAADSISENIVNTKDKEEMRRFLTKISIAKDSSDSTRWADTQGNFGIGILDNNNQTMKTEFYHKEVDPKKIFISIENLKTNIITRHSVRNDSSYDPRKSSWYQKATDNKTAWTNLTFRRGMTDPAFTVSIPVLNSNGTLKGVIGLDVKLSRILDIINLEKISPHGFNFVLSVKTGEIIGFPGFNQYLKMDVKNRRVELPTVYTIRMPWIAKSLEEYKKTGIEKFTIDYAGHTYYFSYKPIPSLSKYGLMVGSVIPESDFNAELVKMNTIILGICLLILFAGIAIIMYIVKRIINPIEEIVNQAKKIKNFDLSGDINIHSKIKEVFQLTEAVKSMKLGLRSFQNYVPKTLVRQLIEAEEASHIGGVKKQLAIFFSDIKDFTKISETMEPNQLMYHVCEYFEEMSNVIIKNRGTIDKYIGDSIMAFWGAPLDEPFPAEQAARSAIQCKQKLDLLNARWLSEGKPAFYTRFAVHIGDVIVGNVGSSDRFNYTAIGDNVNITSRFEKINAVYGTHIMMSDAIYQEIKDQFIWRMVDRVTVKGKVKSHTIYELLSESDSWDAYDIVQYRTDFEKGFHAYCEKKWDEAIHSFNKCITIYSADTVAPLFIKRCIEFKEHPPFKDWDGTWVYSL